MNDEFPAAIAEALRIGGWVVGPGKAFRTFDRQTRAIVFPSGAWSLMEGLYTTQQGKCDEVVEAALEVTDRAYLATAH